MHNSTLTNPHITEKLFTYTMQAWEEKLDGKIAMMVSIINLDTYKGMHVATNTIKVQIASISTGMGAMAMEFKLSNEHL